MNCSVLCSCPGSHPHAEKYASSKFTLLRYPFLGIRKCSGQPFLRRTPLKITLEVYESFRPSCPTFENAAKPAFPFLSCARSGVVDLARCRSENYLAIQISRQLALSATPCILNETPSFVCRGIFRTRDAWEKRHAAWLTTSDQPKTLIDICPVGSVQYLPSSGRCSQDKVSG